MLTQLDSIAYHNPAYFSDYADWRGYRELARQALAFADRVVFCSPHARDDSLAEDLVDDERAVLVPLGIDHRVVVPGRASRSRPPGVEGRPFLLCLGTDFLHKNRLFALQLFERLRERHGFGGRLVLAGPRAARGTSAAEEAAWRAAHPQLAADVVALGECTEAEKAWLYRDAALVLYPTTFEGFGFIPFEAAEAGAPSLWADQSSMGDLLPSEHAGIVPWDADASAANAARLIEDPAAREALVTAVRAAGADFTWDRTAEQLLAVYREAATAPRRDLGRAARVALRPRDVARRPARLAEPRRPARAARGQRPAAAQARRVQRAARRLPRDVPGAPSAAASRRRAASRANVSRACHGDRRGVGGQTQRDAGATRRDGADRLAAEGVGEAAQVDADRARARAQDEPAARDDELGGRGAAVRGERLAGAALRRPTPPSSSRPAAAPPPAGGGHEPRVERAAQRLRRRARGRARRGPAAPSATARRSRGRASRRGRRRRGSAAPSRGRAGSRGRPAAPRAAARRARR